MSSPQPMAASLMGPPPYADRPVHDPCQRSASRQPSPPSALDVTPKLMPASRAAVDQLQSPSQHPVAGLPDEYKTQTDRERQSAASALLAQILAGQQGQLAPEKPAGDVCPQNETQPPVVTTSPVPSNGKNENNNLTHEVNGPAVAVGQSQLQLSQSQDIAPLPHSPVGEVMNAAETHQLDEDEDATDKVIKAAWDMSEPRQPCASSVTKDYLPDSFQESQTTENNACNNPGNDLLLGAIVKGQTNLEPDLNHHLYSDLVPLTTPKTAKEALVQHDLLNDDYLDSANMNAGPTPRIVGYPELPTPSEADRSQNGTGSVAASEPRIQAFAKLEFDDGHFYVNTYSFILGRDVRAARAAFQRELQAKQASKGQGPGSVGATPNKLKRDGNTIMGSVISEKGGIMGYDPDVPQNGPPQMSWKSSNNSSSGDQPSHPVLHMSHAEHTTDPTEKKDYNALAMQSLQKKNEPKRVDTLNLLPSPEACPTIPIHPPANADGSAASHRSISRKHVKIAYNFNKNLFEMHVLGRNGAFKGADWLAPGQVRPLHSGDYIQIGGVRVRFLLPDVPIGDTGADREDSTLPEESHDVPANTVEEEAKVPVENKVEPTKKVEKPSTESKPQEPKKPPTSAAPEAAAKPSLDANGNPIPVQPVKRRGPGRPPKDGIMSKRERAELAREQKLAAKREANGGVTPPPTSRPKSGKKEGDPDDPSKQEKRKYTKRKKPDTAGSGDGVLPSIEGGEGNAEAAPEASQRPPPVKKRKPSRSPSPDYPPESFYTPKELAKPPYNYAVLIYDALSESPHPMTLKQIYRALKLKYPYFRFRCETEGWTSSVRHNLNGNTHLFMHAERDGKGWSWKIIPGASVDKEKKRRPSPPPMPETPSVPQHQYAAPPPNPQKYPPPQPGQPSQQFQYSPAPMGTNPYGMAPPQPPAPSPYYVPQPQPAKQFSLPESLRKSLPSAFAPPTQPTYRSPYPVAPPSYIAKVAPQQQPPQRPPQYPQQQYQFQRQPQLPPQQFQHQHPHPPTHHPPHQHQHQYAPLPPPPPPPPPPPQQSFRPAQPHSQPPTTFTFQARPQPVPTNHNPPPPPPPAPANVTQGPAPPPVSAAPPSQPIPPPPHQQHPPPPPPPPPAQPQPQQMPPTSDPAFMARANQAIDNFEAVLIEDYEDKEYIRKVLRSARDRVLHGAKESSFPGGEPPDEAVIIDALKGIIGQLNEEENE